MLSFIWLSWLPLFRFASDASVAGGIDERTGLQEVVGAECWRDGFSYGLCCVPPVPWCFDADFTAELCCSKPPSTNPFAGVQLHGLDGPQLVSREDIVGLRVDLVVRSYWKAAEMLLLLVHSLELYWPKEAGNVIVILDDTSEDAAVCRLLPAWIRCLLDPPPEVVETFSDATRALRTSLKGMLTKELALLEVDKYSDADYIAVVDADTVFVTYGAPELFFARMPSKQVLPIQYGRSSGGPFRNTVKVLGLGPWVAEFMDSFPQVFHRDHFHMCREYIRSMFGAGTVGKTASFRQAFATLAARVAEESDRAEFPSFHTVMGAFVYRHYQNEYAWAIQYGWMAGVPWNQTCPGLRVVAHVSYSGRRYVANPVQPFVEVEDPAGELFQPRLGPHGHWPYEDLGAAIYSTRAWHLMLAGVCAVKWHVGEVKTQDALLELQHEACTQNLSKLMLSNGYGREWKSEQAPHCGGRQPRHLWAEYAARLASQSFRV